MLHNNRYVETRSYSFFFPSEEFLNNIELQVLDSQPFSVVVFEKGTG